MSEPDKPSSSDPAGRRSGVGSVWLQQRSKAWLWAAAFVVVVLAAVVVLFALDPQPPAGG